MERRRPPASFERLPRSALHPPAMKTLFLAAGSPATAFGLAPLALAARAASARPVFRTWGFDATTSRPTQPRRPPGRTLSAFSLRDRGRTEVLISARRVARRRQD
ncbi:hypothetical protein FRACA_180019 [Frankia canadensis]|uniref:Uncharacterized protein n=1 Tax=Frankia canadensis TaxID=1836972 RepID=A0A2I2KNL0_9ACTN|nr:hypothetical protein FRACA_180019 [Frankia canadensis]SOU54545.1 hypothetical protein FRACA_180019 [Frankia canadensis]